MPSDEPPIRVLLAEDNEANVLTISDYLTAFGFDVHVVLDGEQAVASVQETRFDVILMDIQMPRMDGLEAIRRIRAMPDRADIPIVALTALAMPGDRQNCLEAGASDYLPKPVSLRSLKELLHTYVARSPNRG